MAFEIEIDAFLDLYIGEQLVCEEIIEAKVNCAHEPDSEEFYVQEIRVWLAGHEGQVVLNAASQGAERTWWLLLSQAAYKDHLIAEAFWQAFNEETRLAA